MRFVSVAGHSIFMWALVWSVEVSAAEVLTDSALAPLTDGQGMLWDVTPDGQLNDGSNDCFDTAMTAEVAGHGWSCSQRKQTSDGHEYVLIGKAGDLEVTRRIRLDPQRAWIRYLEIITNPTAKAVPCTLKVNTNLGGNAQLFSTDGKPFSGGAIAKGNLGFAAVQQQRGQSRPSVLWLVGDGEGPAVPSLSTQGGRTLNVTWTMTVPPKGRMTVMHLMAQRSTLNASQFADTIKPVWRRKLVKPQLPAGTKLDNWRQVAEVVIGLPLVQELAERYAIEDRSVDTLILDSGEGARMSGQLTGGPLQIATRLGNGAVPLAQIAASVAVEGAMRLFLRNGEILVADPATPISGAIELTSSEGVRLPVDPTRSQAVVMRHEPTDGQPGAAVGFLKLVDGTRLAVSGTLPDLPVIASWGAVNIPFEHIAKLTRITEPRPAWHIHLDDGSMITAVPAIATLALPTTRYGVKPVSLTMVSGYDRVRLAPESMPILDDELPPTWRGFVLAGNQRIAGSFADAQVKLSVSGILTDVPTAKIQSCAREGAAFAVHLSDGASIAGQLPSLVSVSGGSAAWRIPGSMFMQWANGVVPKVVEPESPGPAPAGATSDVPGSQEKVAGAAVPAPGPGPGGVTVDVQTTDDDVEPEATPPQPESSTASPGSTP